MFFAGTPCPPDLLASETSPPQANLPYTSGRDVLALSMGLFALCPLPMTEARVIALVLGVTLVIVILGYNYWRLRPYVNRDKINRDKNKRATAPQASSDGPSVEGRRDPVLGDLTEVAATADPARLQDGAQSPIPSLVAQASEPRVPNRPPDEIDPAPLTLGPVDTPTPPATSGGDIVPEVDTIATVVLTRDTLARELAPLYSALTAIGRQTLVESLTDGLWTLPQGLVRDLRIGMQLANRVGPIDANDFAHFQQAVNRFAAAHGAHVQFEDGREAVARAIALDRACAETDIEVVVNVIDEAGHGLARNNVARSARAFNLTEAGERFLAFGIDGRQVYELRLERLDPPATGVRVCFALDVSQVESGHDAWAEMVATARGVAAQLHGRLIDDKGQPLAEAGLDALARTIATVQTRMRAVGVSPGSAVAARLYS
jgi:hypothetical protein